MILNKWKQFYSAANNSFVQKRFNRFLSYDKLIPLPENTKLCDCRNDTCKVAELPQNSYASQVATAVFFPAVGGFFGSIDGFSGFIFGTWIGMVITIPLLHVNLLYTKKKMISASKTCRDDEVKNNIYSVFK